MDIVDGCEGVGLACGIDGEDSHVVGIGRQVDGHLVPAAVAVADLADSAGLAQRVPLAVAVGINLELEQIGVLEALFAVVVYHQAEAGRDAATEVHLAGIEASDAVLV